MTNMFNEYFGQNFAEISIGSFSSRVGRLPLAVLLYFRNGELLFSMGAPTVYAKLGGIVNFSSYSTRNLSITIVGRRLSMVDKMT
jgi:hypothetical protein